MIECYYESFDPSGECVSNTDLLVMLENVVRQGGVGV